MMDSVDIYPRFSSVLPLMDPPTSAAKRAGRAVVVLCSH